MSDDQQPVALTPDVSVQWGERLAKARRDRGWSLTQVATRLKLTEDQVLAMEAGDLLALGVEPLFVQGYVRNYVQLLGLDESLSAPVLSASAAPVGALQSVNLVGETFSVRERRVGRWWWMLLLVALLVLVGWQLLADLQLEHWLSAD